MSLLDGIELFAATVEARSFAAAARKLGVTPSAVSRQVARLEHELGVTLLVRTTRTLRLTDDGRGFHARCLRILEELAEARDAIARSARRPSGILRVDAPVGLGRRVITPKLPEFLDRYPELRVDLTLRDQFVDPIAEGLDLVVRMGALGDSTLIARRLGASRLVLCAAPAYLARHGTPRVPRDLTNHACLGYLREGRPSEFRFGADAGAYGVEIAGMVHANDADVLRQLAIAGRGIAAIFDFLVRDAIDSGALVEVLADHPSITSPIHALYPKNRHLLPKVGVFLDFLAKLCDWDPGPRARAASDRSSSKPRHRRQLGGVGQRR